jgi:RND family efflux transporter MFP subunit
LLGAAVALSGLSPPGLQAAEPTRVTSRPLAEIVIYPELSAPATVRSLNDSRISAEIDGRIETIRPRVGDRVVAGEIMVELDCREDRLELARAAARLKLAKQQLSRVRTLRTDANVSEELLDQRETEFTEAELAHEDARLDVERCTLQAPFDGVVLERLASEGELAAPGTPLLRLLETTRLEVSAQVPLGSIDSLEQAEQVWFTSGTRRYALRLRAMTSAVNTKTRSREVRYELAENGPLPGTAGRLHWRSGRAHVPADLTLRRNGRLGILIVAQGLARFLALPEALEGHPAPIELTPGTEVIIEGRHGLDDGDPVEAAAGPED